MKSKWRYCSCALIGVLFFICGHAAPAQQAPPEAAAPGSRAAGDLSLGLEYLKFLREEEKSHREYLEKLYTTTTIILSVLVTAGIGFISFFQYRTRADVKNAVDAQFRNTVEKELEKRVDRSIEKVENDANRRMDDLFASKSRALEEMILAGAPDRVEQAEEKHEKPDKGAVAADSLNEHEAKILRLVGKSKFSFRSQFGISKDAGHIPGGVIVHLDNLVDKGFLGKTLGRTGGERWFVTAEGRKYLMAQ